MKVLIVIGLLMNINAFATNYDCEVSKGNRSDDFSSAISEQIKVKSNGEVVKVGSISVQIEQVLSYLQLGGGMNVKLTLTENAESDGLSAGKVSYTIGDFEQKVLVSGIEYNTKGDQIEFVEVICTKL